MAEHDPGDELLLEELDDVAGGDSELPADNSNCTNTNCAVACSSTP